MKNARAKKKRSLLRFLLFLFILIVLAFFAGFLFFLRHVQNLSTPTNVPIADGIVVWTGKGGNRLTTAGSLLEQERGERLLVSGINPALSTEDVIGLLGIATETGLCCVDLDYEAQDTIGNARETQHWVKSLNYEHIILVTSDYHMPRASLEIRNLSGRVRITPYPVSENNSTTWWKDEAQRKRLFQEYGKLLLTYLRNSGGKSEREAAELPDMNEQKSD